jgi:membrane protein YqaA with SNARE-associated domain
MIEAYYQQMQEILSNSAFQDYGVLGLFFNSLLSATAIPLPTEILTSALLVGGENEFLIAIVLITGSSIGGLINYFIGFGGNKLFAKYKNKKNQKNLNEQKKSHKILNKFGWSAIFFSSWIPVVGDLILISGGAKKLEFKKFVLFMISGKIIKSVIVVAGLGALF